MTGKLEQWLQDLDLVKYRDAFAENEIKFGDLAHLTEDDLKEMGLPIGPRRRILQAIADSETPKHLAEDSEISPEPNSGSTAERRQLTIMFCDLVGSTALSGKLDPEEMREVITTYQNIVAGAVTRFDGNVAKYMGDGVLCYFGWPHAHEDDAERALRAGLAIMDDLSGARTPNGEPLAARAGIATGLVVVGDLVGKAAAQEEAVIGETPNLAARLQGLAAPNTVVISDSTRRLLGQVFELQDLGAQTFRGIAEPVAVYSVLREASIESRFEARHGGATLELVGRDEELALLLRRWQQACQGEGQAALISGEAGIGKSRLLRAFGDAVKGQRHYRINYQCSPHHIDSPLYPVIQQLTRAAGLEATDSDDVKLEKLEALIGLADRDLEKSVPFIAALLDIDGGPRYGKLDLTPQRMRTETLQALKAQLLGLARGQPVFLVLEDVHWADPTTLEFIDHSLEEVSQAGVMILMTARPSFAHRIVGHPSVTSLVLNRLSRESCMGIIDALTAGKSLPGDVLDAIITKTDGVPLFVEEMTKTVLEMEPRREGGHDEYVDHQIRPLAIPSTLQDSLMARLDRHSMAKEVAQIGACIGREFDHDLLAEISPFGEIELEAALAALVDTGVVYRRGEPPEASYIFKHALVRDAAYESLLKTRRTDIHRCVAESLNKLRPDQMTKQPEVLAYHYSEAGMNAEAVRRWIDAAKRATERSAYIETLALLRRALPLLDSLPRDIAHVRCALDIQTLRAGALLATRGYVYSETVDAFEQARVLCRELDEPPEVYQVFRGLCSIETMKGNLPAALVVAEECLHLAEAQDDSAPLSLGHRLVGQCCFLMGDFLEARSHAEKAIDLYEPEQHQRSAAIYGLDLRTAAAQIMGLDLCLLGFPDQAIVMSQDVVNYARQLGFVFGLAVALEWANPGHMFRGEYDIAYENANELMRLANKYKLDEYVDIATTNQGLALALRGPADPDSIGQLRRHILSYQNRYGAFFAPVTLGLLAEALGAVGQIDEALDVIGHALENVQLSKQHWNDAELYRLKGTLELLDNKSKTEQAERSFERALTIARRQRAKWLELRAATDLARLWESEGKVAEARKLIAPTCDWFTEGFEIRDLTEAKALLERLD